VIPAVLIRAAIPADLPQVRALEQQTETAAHWAEREYDALFAADAPRRVALVASTHDDEIVGFAVARCDPAEWEIENVVVDGARRRKRIGSALVREMMRLARTQRTTSVLLEVRESNQAACGLYRALGFKEVGRRRNYYNNPTEDALIMRHDVAIS